MYHFKIALILFFFVFCPLFGLGAFMRLVLIHFFG